MPINYSVYRDSHGQAVQSLRVGHDNQTSILSIATVTTAATSVLVTSPVVRVVGTVNSQIVWSQISATVSSASSIANTASDMYLPANVVEYHVVDHGKHISAISATGATGGVLYITEAL
jgi:hypothetical protein